ncbi:MAG TPA: CGGC domain-containing protein [Methanosarcinales archaeon]|nr:CGGC domain-containing protein [Methanosarcinales archaeon]
MEKKSNNDTINIAVVRCDIVSEACPGVGCFKAFFERKKYFKEYGPNAKIIGFFTCGGCPGRRVYRLVNALKKHNLDVVHLSSCILMEDSYPKCPNKENMKKSIEKLGVRVVEGTHP